MSTLWKSLLPMSFSNTRWFDGKKCQQKKKCAKLTRFAFPGGLEKGARENWSTSSSVFFVNKNTLGGGVPRRLLRARRHPPAATRPVSFSQRCRFQSARPLQLNEKLNIKTEMAEAECFYYMWSKRARLALKFRGRKICIETATPFWFNGVFLQDNFEFKFSKTTLDEIRPSYRIFRSFFTAVFHSCVKL